MLMTKIINFLFLEYFPLGRNVMRFSLLGFFVLNVFGKLSAQDPVFSQFYNAYLQLNPAMAGNSRGPVFQMNYRNQWPGLGKIYSTYSVAYDQYINSIKSGIGVSLLADNAGDGILRNTGVTGYYSYRIRIKGDVYVKGGLEVGLNNMALNTNKLLFGDAIDPISGPISPGGTPYPTKELLAGETSKTYLNLGAGLLLSSPDYYLGLGLKNLNTPDISFLNGENLNNGSLQSLPVRFVLHGGTQIILRPGNKNVDPTFISPNIMIQRQRDFNQINLGAYMSVNKVHGGLWYRHTLYNGDALIASFGVRKDFLKITYSFDITMSELGLQQGGSHEVGLSLNFDYLYPKKFDYNDCNQIFR